ncbi:biotin transporter BioY [Jannaschia seohaensis]|uniref:Biotin transporter n=1 Tax=Jannaschia seohaensis TaxID=475081 RepID=A0A2Y9AR89_9RHOB|nr:biotin transporter BioY [Jannaschia seohaensis]PWJ19176.1 biotin transport system substrate-specific component [Jannaschia seohaensis]SSA45838.1 biotin transport system substrate-specific component [Jannaschia seohaensis]
MTPNLQATQRPSLSRQAAYVLAGTLVIALAAQVSIPFYPVPMTLQTLAILGVGFALGARLGAITLVTYLAQGAIGLPVFANFGNGAAFFGPTAGFLVGFVGLAFLAGLARDRGLTGPVGLSAVAVAASLALYVPGLAWPMGVAGALGVPVWGADLAFGPLAAAFMTPFLVGDLVKAVIAGLLASGVLTWMQSRR